MLRFLRIAKISDPKSNRIFKVGDINIAQPQIKWPLMLFTRIFPYSILSENFINRALGANPKQTTREKFTY